MSESLKRLPAAFRPEFKRGIGILSRIEARQHTYLFEQVIQGIESDQSSSAESVKRNFNLSDDEATALMSAAMVSAGTMSGEANTARDFIDSALKAGLLEENQAASVLPYLQLLESERDKLRHTIRLRTVADQVFPSLSDSEITVDVRLGFEGNRIDLTVPVALMHIDTDHHGTELRVQASEAQLEKLKTEIEMALQRMKVAKLWADNRLKNS